MVRLEEELRGGRFADAVARVDRAHAALTAGYGSGLAEALRVSAHYNTVTYGTQYATAPPPQKVAHSASPAAAAAAAAARTAEYAKSGGGGGGAVAALPVAVASLGALQEWIEATRDGELVVARAAELLAEAAAEQEVR